MSNLLEQAIVDATALREVAMKSAEANLIEKYSKEFKESVEKLLEQEEAAPSLEDAAAQMPDPTPAPVVPETDTEKEKAFDNVSSSFLSGDEDTLITIDFDQLKKQVAAAMGAKTSLMASPEAPAMTEGLEIEEADERGSNESTHTNALDGGLVNEEDVEEDFLMDPEHAKEKAKEHGSHEEAIHVKMTSPEEEDEQEEYEYEWELEEEGESELEEGAVDAAADKLASATKVQGAAQSDYYKALGQQEKEAEAAKKASEEAAAKSKVKMEENIEISIEELQELAEAMKVDIEVENLSDGHMGVTAGQKREQRNMELAAARSDEEKERREQEAKEMSDLQEKLAEAIEVGSALVEENDELKEKLAEMAEHLNTLKENVEKLSISNAKLLYTNKALGNASLNERQKQQIVENISNSTSVLEAKTIYNTLQSTVSSTSSKKSSKESLSEALIRGGSPFMTRKTQTADIPFAERMKVLAGIKPKN